jgi:hypothetical protein
MCAGKIHGRSLVKLKSFRLITRKGNTPRIPGGHRSDATAMVSVLFQSEIHGNAVVCMEPIHGSRNDKDGMGTRTEPLSQSGIVR